LSPTPCWRSISHEPEKFANPTRKKAAVVEIFRFSANNFARILRGSKMVTVTNLGHAGSQLFHVEQCRLFITFRL
jgi:hypothetical protein